MKSGFLIPAPAEFNARLSAANSLEEVEAILTELKELREEAKAILSGYRNESRARSSAPVRSANTELIKRTALANGRKQEFSKAG